MLNVGKLVVKTAGRDSSKIGVIVDSINDTYVLVDGQMRRKRCNRLHLESLNKEIKIKPGASTETVVQELEKLGIHVKKTKKIVHENLNKASIGDKPDKKKKTSKKVSKK